MSNRSSKSHRSTTSKKTSDTTFSMVSEQLEIVKKMQKDAMIAEKYANKKRMQALKEIHKLRNLEISEMYSQYRDGTENPDEQDFIETQSYLEISKQ